MGPWQSAGGRAETVLAGEAMALTIALGWVEGPFLGDLGGPEAQLQESPKVCSSQGIYLKANVAFRNPYLASGMWKYNGWVRGATGLK